MVRFYVRRICWKLRLKWRQQAAELFIGQGIRTSLETNGPDLLTKEAVCLKASCGAGHLDSILRGLARIDLEKPAPSFEPIRERLEEMEDRESLCTIFFSADARPEFQQLLEKIQERKNENLSVLSGKPYNSAGNKCRYPPLYPFD